MKSFGEFINESYNRPQLNHRLDGAAGYLRDTLSGQTSLFDGDLSSSKFEKYLSPVSIHTEEYGMQYLNEAIDAIVSNELDRLNSAGSFKFSQDMYNNIVELVVDNIQDTVTLLNTLVKNNRISLSHMDKYDLEDFHTLFRNITTKDIYLVAEYFVDTGIKYWNEEQSVTHSPEQIDRINRYRRQRGQEPLEGGTELGNRLNKPPTNPFNSDNNDDIDMDGYDGWLNPE